MLYVDLYLGLASQVHVLFFDVVDEFDEHTEHCSYGPL